MAKIIHVAVRDRLLTEANLTLADAALFALARQAAAFIRARDLAGLDITDPADLAALATELGTADLNTLIKILKLAESSGLLVKGF